MRFLTPALLAAFCAAALASSPAVSSTIMMKYSAKGVTCVQCHKTKTLTKPFSPDAPTLPSSRT